MKKSGRDATLIYTYRDQHYAFVSLSRANQYTCTNQTTVKAARFLATYSRNSCTKAFREFLFEMTRKQRDRNFEYIYIHIHI